MKVAAVQFKPRKGDPAAALEALCALITQAAQQGAALVVCPEMATSGYLFRDAAAVRPLAEPARGGGFPQLAALARRHGCHIVVGYAEIATSPDDAAGADRPLYNSARIIGPDGSLRANYRKRLLYISDLPWAQPGDQDYPLLDTQLGSLAVGICMDLNDDRFIASLRTHKPRLIAFCTNWIDEGLDVRLYWRYRLLGVHSYFIAANTYGWEHAEGHEPTCFCGRSAILAPDGRTLALAPKEGDAVITADLP